MELSLWLIYLSTSTAMALSPGPAVLFVVGSALRSGCRTSAAAAAGIELGNAIYFLASALGLGVLITKAGPLFFALKWAGVAYLLWMGLRALLSRPKTVATTAHPVDPSKTIELASHGRSAGRAFLAATALQLGNPKALLFFTALLPQFISLESRWPMFEQITVLGLTLVGVELSILLGYGAIAAKTAARTSNPKVMATFDKVSGVCLLGCAGLAIAA